MKNLLVIISLLAAALFAPARALNENEKIEYLVSSVGSLEGTMFIRNGNSYEAKQAMEHLRMKLQKAGNRVKTAEDFIRLIAAKSYLSGKPYIIKFEDGKEIQAETFFRAKLKEANEQQ